jgi:signal transduction histidine kinase
MATSPPSGDPAYWSEVPYADKNTDVDWSDLLDSLRDEFWLREEELKLLHKIDLQLLENGRRTEGLLTLLVGDLARILKCELAAVLLRRGTQVEVTNVNVSGSLGQLLPISRSLVGQSITEAATIIIPDILNHVKSDDYVKIMGYDGPPMRSMMATPIILHREPIGALHVESTRVGAFRSVHRRVLEAVASQAAIALEKNHNFDSAVLFAEVDSIIFSNDDSQQQVVKTALDRVVSKLTELEKIELFGAQVLFPRGENYLEIVYSTKPEDVGLFVEINHSVSGRAATERQTIVLGDVKEDEKYRRILGEGESIRSEIAVPIMFGADSYVIGVLNVESEQPDAFSGFNRVALEAFADRVKTLLAFAKLKTDVSESLEIRQANDLMIAIGDQAAHIVHRIKNIVGALRFDIQSLQDQLEHGTLSVGPALARKLEHMMDEVDDTLRLPEWLSGVLRREESATDINSCIETALQNSDLPSNVLVETCLARDIPRLPLFAFDIVVQNLIQNALDAMPEGGTLTATTLQHLPPDLPVGYVQLIVQDTGIGISDEAHARMFDLNFTTKTRRGQGLGFGMWWVRNFVRRVGGEIWATNRKSGGAEVTVQIPIKQEITSSSEKSGVGP